MRGRVVSIMLGLAAIAGGCTTMGTPATAPPTTTVHPAPTSSTSTSTSTLPTTTTIVTTTTTTVDRFAEVQAIFNDLKQRRLVAVNSHDAIGFASLFIPGPFKDLAIESFEQAVPIDTEKLRSEVIEVSKDEPNCLVIVAVTERTDIPNSRKITATTLMPLADGWGYAYVTEGEDGWLCDGSHPLSGS